MRRPLDVVTVGEALVDLVAPDAADLASARRFLPAPGGAPANVAAAVARLGGHAAFVGAVGDDAFGGVLRQTLENFGVDLTGMRVVEGRTTLALVASGGDAPDFVFYRDADARLTPDDISPDLVARAHFVHVSSMALLEEPARSATLRAVALAHDAGTGVGFDPNIRPSLWRSLDDARRALAPVIAASDILKVSAGEAETLTGMGDPRKALHALGREDALVVITLGSEGCLWRYRSRQGEVASVPVEVVETTGAGDAFIAALLFRLSAAGGDIGALAPETLVECLRFASAAAALTCTQPGAMAALPMQEQVLALLGRSDGSARLLS
jgi:fructokinase